MQRFNPARFLLVSCLMFFLTVDQHTFAQIPHTLSYQAVLTDNAGVPKPDGSYSITFRLYTAVSGGTALWTESQTLQVRRGLFSAVLGSVTPFGVDLTFAQPYWLSLQVAPDAEMTPRLPLTSTAYSLAPWTSIGSSVYVSDVLVGIGIVPDSVTGYRLDVNGQTLMRTGGTGGGFIAFGTPNAETGMTISGNNRANLRFDGNSIKLLASAGTGPPPASNGVVITTDGNVAIGHSAPTTKLDINGKTLIRAQDGLQIVGYQPFLTLTDANTGYTNSRVQGANGDLIFYPHSFIGGAPAMVVKSTSGNVGIGMTSPLTRLALSGGPQWTSNLWNGSLSMSNGSALGWEANASGQRFGIGQSTGGLYFFRTTSAFGTTGSPANYDLELTDTGNLTQARDKGGLVKAMIYVNANGTIARCYNGITNSSTGNCGFSISHPFTGRYSIDFGFQVNDRFVSVTAQQTVQVINGVNIGTGYYFPATPNTVVVTTFITDVIFDESQANNPFMIIIY